MQLNRSYSPYMHSSPQYQLANGWETLVGYEDLSTVLILGTIHLLLHFMIVRQLNYITLYLHRGTVHG